MLLSPPGLEYFTAEGPDTLLENGRLPLLFWSMSWSLGHKKG